MVPIRDRFRAAVSCEKNRFIPQGRGYPQGHFSLAFEPHMAIHRILPCASRRRGVCLCNAPQDGFSDKKHFKFSSESVSRSPLTGFTMADPSPFYAHPEVRKISLLSDVTRWRQEKLGRFPRRIKITNRKVAYRKSDIDDWARDPEDWRARNVSRAADLANLERDE